MFDPKLLDQLGPVTDEMLGGLHGDDDRAVTASNDALRQAVSLIAHGEAGMRIRCNGSPHP